MVVTNSGTMTPAQFVAGMKTSEQYGFLWGSPAAQDDLSDLSGPNASQRYRDVRSRNPKAIFGK